MIFSSYEFIFIFLPIVLVTYYLIGRFTGNQKIQNLLLVVASLFFYGYFNPAYLLIIISSIIVNYILAILIQKSDNTALRKLMLIIGIIFNVGLIGYYKYFDFFTENINLLFKTDFALRNILLPLGISFFTFQQFSFLISIYQKEEYAEDFIAYCLFVTFFPQLVAGPIVLYSEMIPQFHDSAKRKLNIDNFARGFYIFTIGLFKKIVIADTLAVLANNGFDTVKSFGFCAAWATALAYTLQIYFDFSGYSEMAIGLGKMFNIELPVNFDSPYKSKSIREFWRRWHMTLGRALTKFIYLPLGGNRKGLFRTCVNLLVVFIVSGFWHGASWTFILWGFMHGLLSVIERVFEKYLEKIPSSIRQTLLFVFLASSWVLFRATSWDTAKVILKGMYMPDSFDIGQLSAIGFDGLVGFPQIIWIMYVVGIIAVLIFGVLKWKNALQMQRNFSYSTKNIIFTIVAFCISVIHLSRTSVFIYFNF